jgi:branched-chain amino acid transport system ATP-binding protein
MLFIKDIDVYYHSKQALFGISLEVKKGELVSIIGANGAGKTTLLKSIVGILRADKGRVTFQDTDITGTPSHKIIKMGIGYVPEGRQLFSNMSVIENLEAGSYAVEDYDKKAARQKMELMYQYFPVIASRKNQLAGSLSGGEQQMLAIARGLVGDPKLLLLDEPSLGLAPLVVDKLFEIIKTLNEKGLTIMLVEQNAYAALDVSERCYILQTGKIYMHGISKTIIETPEIKKAYLGI